MGENTPRILIIDDVDTNRFVLKDIVAEMGYQPILTENGAQAIKIVEKFEVSLVISDIAMPVMDGFEFCELMKGNAKTRDIPIIFISAFDDPADVVKGFELGGADYVTKPFIPEVVKARIALHMNLTEVNRNLLDLNRKLQASVTEHRMQIEREKSAVLYALIRVARANAAYDETHMERLVKNSRTLAEAMQLSPKFDMIISDSFIDTIAKAAPLCDLGNVSIPTHILQKKEELTEEEWALVKTHPEVGARILADIEDGTDFNGFISMSGQIARSHHENWDGTGYPDGLKENEIPLSAQIVAVAGSYCSLTEGRIYREAFSGEKALELMAADSGKRYNPDIVEVLQKISKILV